MDPFVLLGISRDSSSERARQAWRDKARVCHPDAGGSDAAMQELNEALRLVLVELAVLNKQHRAMDDGTTQSETSHVERDGATQTREHIRQRSHWARTSRDVSSLTIDCLPVEAFEALLLASSWHGDVSIEESPYLLEIIMRDPFPCWVRFDVVPEAGASMVSITVATAAGERPVASEDVRDVFVDSLNQLNWEDIHS